MKKLAALLTIALTTAAFQARALNPGDIAFTGFNADGNDDLAFVTLVEIPAATEIHFSDNEWNGLAIGSGGAFNTGEGTYTWTATATVPAGSVVTLDSLGTASPASNLGTVAIVSGSLNLGASNEAVHAYQGTPTVPTVFLTAFGNDTPSAAGTDLTGTGLTEGVNAFFITGDADGFRYKGPRIGQLTFAAYLPLIADTATNWDVEASDGTLYLPFDTTAFTIAASSEVSIADASVNEGDAGTVLLEFTVSRTDPASEFSVDVAVTGGSALVGTDFVNPGTVTLNFTAAGVNSQTVSLTVNSDTELEIDETVEVTLSNVVNTTGTTTIASGSAVGTITNDDFLPVTYPPSNAFSFSAKGAISERSAGVPLAGAEIPAFDPVSKRAFLSSGTGVEVIDLTNPAAPTFVKNLDLTAAPYSLASNDVSSVAVKNGVLAAAVIASPKTGNGTVIFIDAATEALLGTASVGSVPDHVGFTPDGTKVLVAIEGELTDTADVNSNPATDTIPGGVAIIDVSGGFAAAPVTTAGFAAFDGDVAALRAAGVRIFDGGVPSTDFEPEYFAISPDSTTAVVTLQEANAVGLLDIATATFTSIRALGEKDFSGLMADFSDRDGAGAANLIKPTTGNPVFGLYMPDQIASFEANGQLYFITANEGDDRDDFLPTEETIRVGSGSYDLDDTVFPNEAALKNNANLGRLTVSNAPGLRGDNEPDGDIDRILTYGGRSFSIWDTAGNLVYDSGDMLEMIVATQFPASFDDGRSDNKGPEPEGVTVAEVDGRTLAFVGLERSNMVVVFDVTNPLAPTYVTALQNAGDVSPEGLLTVSSADSPSGRPLVLVANEVSNSLTVYQLNPKLIITEVQSNQVVSGAGDYWELTNAGDTTVDLSNWSWDDNSIAAGTVMIPNGTMIAPGESVIFTGVAAETFRTRWNLPPSVQVITGAGAPGLGGGDGVYLFDADGTLITSFDFAAGNFTKVDGSPSLGGHAGPSAGGTLDAQAAVIDPFFGTGNPRYTFADGTTLGTFASTASPDELGSPGSALLAPRLLVTELNSSGAPADFWEVTNVGVAAVDLSGWSWDDDSDTPGTVVIPDGTSIAAGESVIFTSADPAAFRTLWGLSGSVQVINGTGSVPGFGGSGDRVTLYDDEGAAVASFSYFPGGFTLSDGSLSSLVAHAGPAAGGSASGQSVILDPAFGIDSPRYTFADGSALGTSNPSGSVTGSPGAANLGATTGTVEIADASVTEGDSGTTLLTLTVTRSSTDTAFSVDYAVTGGTATSGVDFEPLAAGTLNFAATGAATADIAITVNGDVDPEPDETIIVTLSNVVDTTGTTVLSAAEATGVILNDDDILPTITLEPAGTTIASGGVTTLRVAADGFPVPTLQWYQGSSGDTSMPVSGATSATFVTPALSSTTSFWARATNTAGSADSVAATVTVVPAITSVDLSQYVRVGRYDLPEPTRTALPAGTPAHNLLCQEASAVTYNWDTDTLFITGDGGRSITQVSKTGELIDTMTLALGSSPQGTDFYDPEGLTYIGGGQFVMSEERDRNLVKFTYVAGTTLNRAGAQTVNIGPFVDNTGTEGLSFDPLTGDFICLKEISPIGIFQTTVDFGAGTATNKATPGVESTNLFDPALLGMSDVADVFALSNLSGMSGQTQEPFLIVIGQEDARVVNVDRSGNIQSTLQIVTDVGNPLSAGNQQHEGVTMDPAGNLYVVNENGGGDADHPQLWVYAPATAPNAAPTQVVLNNPINAIDENTSTASPIKVGEIVVVDDGLGTNDLSLSGADVAFFEISGADLLLKAGTVLDFETKPSYSIVIEADDTTVGTTPDVTANYTLTVNDLEPETPPLPALIISEVVPWGSSSPVGSDWFEVTNTSDNPVDITGWKMDDNSAVFANAVALNGITTIAAGESVIFIETNDLPNASAAFLSNWFGGSPPVGLQIGSYTGSGVGLSGNGDGVNLYNAAGVLQAGVTFGASPAAAPFTTFDNTTGINNAEITQFSAIGVNGAFAAANNANEIGSPGYAEPGLLRITEVAPWSSGNSPVVGADWFEVTNLGARAVDIRGWKVDDSSESPAAAVALVGIDTIAPGESVIFVESSTPATTVAAFVTNWFGGSAPSGLQIGTYTGSGIGLSTGGDAVNLYDTRTPTPARRASVNFGASPTVAPFATFDNADGLDVATLSQLSAVGVNGAFAVAGGNEIGSPGRVVTPPFMLQILHASDLEGGVDAVSSAPGFAAMVDELESTAAADGIGSILLSAGDNYIPGPFYNAAGDLAVFRTGGVFNDTYNTLFGETRYNALREGEGRVDISIMNVLGFDASAIGNHEFDNTSSFFELIIEEDFRSPNGPASDRWVGAQFPYLSANLDFSGDAFLSDLYTPSILPNTAFATGPAQTDANITNVPKLASATTIDVGGRKVGVVGATTQLLTTISSPSGTVGKTPTVTDMSALAAVLQPVIDDVMNGDDNTPGNSDDVDIIVLVTHLQQIALEKALAPLLSGVDVIIAGGSDTLQANAGTYLRPGDVAAEAYPFQTTNLNSEPVMIVSTDGEYSYLGRLVAGFDANGVLIPSTVDPMVSGPYATDEFGVTSVTGEASLNDAIAASVKATEVKKLTDAVTGVIVAKDSVIHGYTDVYIEGRRQLVRTEETTMGNVTADANLTAARAADPTVAVSIKNGGGIRASIGEIDGFSGALLPPQGNPVASKPVGAVSQLDIENVMRFNNRLMVFETTPADLKALIEHGVSATAPGATPGQFPQVGGMRFSFDPGLSAGSRVRSMVILDAAGNPVDRVVENGIVLGDPGRIIKVVTLNFLANGGDSYPFKANGDNFRYLLTDGSLSDVVPETNDFNTAPGNALGEQAAAAAWFTANHPAPGSAFNVAEVTPEFDTRIQFIGVRADTVLQGAPTLLADWLLANGYTSTSADSDGNGVPDVLEYFFDQSPNDPSDTGNLPRTVQEGGDLELRFRRQANAPDLTGILRWSTNLTQWFNAVLGVDYEVISEVLDGDVVEVRYRLLKGMDDFKFYRFEVTQSP